MSFCQEITNKEVWEGFLAECEEKTFLQSWNWGEFQKSLGNKIWRLGIYNGSNYGSNYGSPTSIISSVALVVKVMAKRGTFLLVPHGPIIKNFKSQITNSKQIPNSKSQILNTLLEKLKEIAREENCGFIRINPILERNEENNEIFKKLGFRQAPLQMHPEASWKLDIRFGEDELLKNMRKTTRYLIRQTIQNKEIQLYQGGKDDIKLFSDLHKRVSQRQNFVPFSLEYLENEFSIFDKPARNAFGIADAGGDNQAFLLFGKYKGEIAAGCFVVFWSGIGFYHHAVSLPEYAKFYIPYLLQWEAIKEAQKRGCYLYDFWGYVEPTSKHPWAGPTLFKMGFGGNTHFYVKTQDFPLSKKYWLTYFFEKIRKAKRGL